MNVRYSANNSGGSWWLDLEDWKKLETGGWRVIWKTCLGSATTEAFKEFQNVDEAKEN